MNSMQFCATLAYFVIVISSYHEYIHCN